MVVFFGSFWSFCLVFEQLPMLDAFGLDQYMEAAASSFCSPQPRPECLRTFSLLVSHIPVGLAGDLDPTLTPEEWLTCLLFVLQKGK